MHSNIQIRNYGCSSNTADGETLAGCLKQAGYTLTTDEAIRVAIRDLISAEVWRRKGVD